LTLVCSAFSSIWGGGAGEPFDSVSQRTSAMLRKSIFTLLLILVSVQASALELQNMKAIGHLTLQGDEPPVVSNNGAGAVQEGPVKIVIESLGLLSHPIRYFSERRLRLRNGEGIYLFRIPEASIRPDGSVFVSSEESGQNVDVELNQTSILQKTWKEKENRSCTYSCIKNVCQADSKGQTSCSSQMSSCDGRQRVLVQYDLYTVTHKIIFGKVRGQAQIQTLPSDVQKEKILKELSSCS
jgi:hypothetical protein